MKRKTMIFITSCIILLPMVIGLLFWNRLPEQLPVHFNFSGEADSWESKTFVVFFFPLFLLAAQLFCAFVTLHDPKEQNISDKLFFLVLLIMPVTSIICGILVYSQALEIDFSVNMLIQLFVGISFIIFGNYMPKTHQNYTIGIKLPWTLNDTENWNRTHRFAGVLWIFCGMAFLVNALWNNPALPIIIVVVAALLPTIYSFVLYKKKQKEN